MPGFKKTRKMFLKSQEYQPLKSQKYIDCCKVFTKIVMCIFIIIQIIILLIWVSTILGKENYIKFSFYKHEMNLKENKSYITNEVYKENLSMFETEKICELPSDNEKFDCYPEKGGNEELCLKRGCCWEPKKSAPLGLPWCYYPKSYGGYKLLNKTETKSGMRAFVIRTFPSQYPDDVKLLRMDIQYKSTHILHVKVLDANSNRYEPPYPEIPVGFDSDPRDPIYKFLPNSNGFKVFRNDEDLLFDSDNVGGFIFSDQFLQMSAKFSGKIYGLGEHQSTLQLNTNWTKFTMFNHDGIPLPNANLYGSHPFYLVLEPSGRSHGVFFQNSNAMDVVLQPLPAITFRSIGGIFDFYFFMGPTPGDVIKQYTEIIGRPLLPPYWSLGFHLSRFGYKDTKHIREVWERTRSAKIPFDTQWHDIDYMHNRNDFTYDKKKYADLPEFIQEVHEAGMHYVPIVDPGINGCEPNGTYPPYDEGVNANIFVKNPNGSIFVGKVWNSKCTVFPDFTAPNATSYWYQQIQKFHKFIPFDGLWIDMNEPSNFLDGSFNGCPSNKWESPIYVPEVVGGKLFDKTICMSAKHHAGLHYNVHNLYGISEAIATYKALRQMGKRPFIISRSTYPGTGQFSGHWSGDVVSTWNAMRKSIPQLLSFSLFGIPLMGADICGFNGNTTDSLCQRWSQLGAFYPFSRNHNTDDAIDQDPVALGKKVVDSTRKALNVRYALLPYLYTLFFKAHTEGETVARPLFFEFPEDNRTHSLDESFLWGCCVLIVPALKEYETVIKTYFPAARWYNWYTGLGTQSNGTETDIFAPSDTISVFIRGGVILPTQVPAVTTTLSRLNKFVLIAAFSNSLNGSGSLYWDDGENPDSLKNGEYGIVNFSLSPFNVTSHISHWNYQKVPVLGEIKILGFVKPIAKIYFNKKEIKFKWNPTTLVLKVKVNHYMNIPFILSW